jgi:hypothetical protein
MSEQIYSWNGRKFARVCRSGLIHAVADSI